ncbi:MAG: hypothetical protein ACKO96_41580 [Flammeovirgaceae bacterium]
MEEELQFKWMIKPTGSLKHVKSLMKLLAMFSNFAKVNLYSLPELLIKTRKGSGS